jgi:cytochrome c oxidase assembly factor CtaG
MVQHLLLMMVAPPLLWLGAPWQPLLQGLPRWMLRQWVGPLLAWRPLAIIGQWLVFPPLALLVYGGGLWAWHAPALYEGALASEFWHVVQHLSFLATSLVFWWPVVQPWPCRQRVPREAIVLYLLLADLQNTVLSAWLVFAERLIYPSYAMVLPVWSSSALNDQAAAGAIMWVPGSIAYLVPLAWIVVKMLNPTVPRAAITHPHTSAVNRLLVRSHGGAFTGSLESVAEAVVRWPDRPSRDC